MVRALLISGISVSGNSVGGLTLAAARFRQVLAEAVDRCDVVELAQDRTFGQRLLRWRADLQFGYPFYGVAPAASSLVPAAVDGAAPDVVVLDGFESAAGVHGLPIERAGRRPPVVVASYGLASMDALHDAHAGRGLRSWLRGRRRATHLGRLIEFERGLLRRADDVWCCSAHELSYLRWLGSASAWVLPKWIPYSEVRRRPVPGRYGYVGTLSHAINGNDLDALVAALSALYPARLLELRIVGQVPDELARRWQPVQGVSILGRLTDAELQAETASWSAMVVPVFRWGKGYSVKVSTALEYGVPLISTPAGVRGYQLRGGVEYLEAANAEEMVAHMDVLAREAALLTRVGTAASHSVRSAWRRQDAASAVRQRLLDVLGRGNAPSKRLLERQT